MIDIFFGIRQRLWLVGPFTLALFWLYSATMLLGKAQRDSGPAGRILLFLPALALALPFAVLNALYNATCGTIIFAELPKWLAGEFFFTQRLKRQKLSYDPETIMAARLLCDQLNKADPGHC